MIAENLKFWIQGTKYKVPSQMYRILVPEGGIPRVDTKARTAQTRLISCQCSLTKMPYL
jgi:hypothetical protein